MADPEKVVAEPETKKKSKKGLLLIGAAVLLVAGGGFAAVHYLSPSNGKAVQSESTSPTVRIKSMMNLDSFLVNLADAESTRFVKVTFRLGLDEPKLGEEYAGDPVILAATRDKILSLLSIKTADDLLTPEGKDRLRNEIREKVNPILPKGKIVNVFIVDFVVQL